MLTRQALVIITGLFVILQSCDRKAKEGSDESLLVDSLETRLSVLNDSLNNAWEQMIEDDNEKLQYMKRLLNEVTYVSNYNEEEYKNLISLVDSLKAMRYDQESMSVSRSIDQYDSATNAVTRMVTDFAYKSSVFEDSDLMKELVEDIHEKNGMVLIYRVHYDAFAEEINEIIEKHSEIIDQIDKEYEILPLFKIPPEEI